jgi:hypothetical protein
MNLILMDVRVDANATIVDTLKRNLAADAIVPAKIRHQNVNATFSFFLLISYFFLLFNHIIKL